MVSSACCLPIQCCAYNSHGRLNDTLLTGYLAHDCCLQTLWNGLPLYDWFPCITCACSGYGISMGEVLIADDFSQQALIDFLGG
jgi:hypothetical protein